MDQILNILKKREDCKNQDPAFDTCERYVSEFTKTGIPLLIGLSLFLLVAIVLFFIVRKQRRRQQAAERAKERMIDDNVELTWVPVPKVQGNGQQWSSQESKDNYGPPPEYPKQAYPPKAYQKDGGRRTSRDSDYV